MSDLNLLVSPKKRFLIQFLIVFSSVLYLQLEVLPTRLDFIDNFFSNKFLSFLFTVFCLMILINGTNFIDGLNGMLLGYFFIILLILQTMGLLDQIIFIKENIYIFFFITFFVLIMNLFNKLFLGDSGAYLIGFLLGWMLITIYNLNNNISPYFVILLFWYPCFECLFSIIRKKFSNNNPLYPDNNHFHQKLFFYLSYKLKFNKKLIHFLTSLIINFFNLVIFIQASKYYDRSSYQLVIIFALVLWYCVLYYYLSKIVYKINRNHEHQK